MMKVTLLSEMGHSEETENKLSQKKRNRHNLLWKEKINTHSGMTLADEAT
jgi:hypothetical protein